MDFERARSYEQKRMRIGQITKAARRLFELSKYEDITLAGIAKELSFTRANLYKYVSTKEEIFLYIIAEDLKEWVDDVETKLTGIVNPETVEFSCLWAEIFDGHMELIKVLSLLYSIIEKNVSVDKLVQFKREFFSERQRVSNLLAKVFPELGKEKIYKFLEMQMYFLTGLFPATTENEIQIKAYEKLGIPYELPLFKDSYAEFIKILLNSML